MTTYQDVVRANGGVASWAFAEASGLSFAPWLGGASLTGTGVFDYQQAGPFASAFSVGMHVGALLFFDLTGLLTVPDTIEVWVKLASTPASPNQIVWALGNAGVNGAAGFITQTTNLLQTVQTSTAYNSGAAVSPGTWHLLQWSYNETPLLTMTIDGIPVFQGPVIGGTASPNRFYLGGSTTRNSGILMNVAYPAIYYRALGTLEANASFLAATDPAAAIAYTPGGQSLAGATNAQLLADIYAAVHKTW